MDLDLANLLLKETYKKHTLLPRQGGRSSQDIRKALIYAKRFVLDEKMSEFLAHLATAPFKVANERREDVLDSLRHTARLPFPKMFIQYDNKAFRKALIELSETGIDIRGEKLLGPESTEILQHIGWLVEQDDKDPNQIWISIFTDVDVEGTIATLPFRFVYRMDDRPLAHDGLKWDPIGGMIGHGIKPLMSPFIAAVYYKNINQFPPYEVIGVKGSIEESDDQINAYIHRMVPEFGGVVRYVLALLATLSDMPTVRKETRPSKGFLGGGQIRKYQDHTVLTLNLPRKMTMRTLAARLIAKARRGWHEVIPHWRINHPKPGKFYCASRKDHIWGETDATGHGYCKQCEANRVYIKLPTGRGDPTISIRTHKYHLTHRED